MSFTNKSYNKYVRTLCAILFYVFVFLYLYIYQQDVMLLTQHLCSGGSTHYHPVIGTAIIMVSLALLQVGVGRIFRSFHLLYALSYTPSFIILTALTSIHLLPSGYTFGAWTYMLPVSLVLFAGVAYILWHISNETRSMFHYSLQTVITVNTLCMLSGFLFTCTLSNSSTTLHCQLKAERLVYDGHADKALDVLKKAPEGDASLTMLTAYALSLEGQLPEKLFTYPIAKGASNLLPDSVHTRLAYYPEGRLYHHIGLYLKQRLSTRHYLQFIKSRRQGTKAFADYYLMALLLDKQLDAFVNELPKFYDIQGNLPLHYREALLLYTHLRTNPLIIFHSNVMDADFQDFQVLEAKYSDKVQRYSAISDVYGNTYWFYYLYR